MLLQFLVEPNFAVTLLFLVVSHFPVVDPFRSVSLSSRDCSALSLSLIIS